ncbi:Probable serine/threonine-protein kinase DDB_G0275165 [Geodia barretti]|uniref:Probable serine/threonine-protein kinase DDB_G0275165 n=1 Tax=Geodia barretti TaxID=519541 RepID=A0AA35WWF5_GEOBA|nr:Probable serine/threonine-protein kinase DDB_G0275165 [Geodia barretti]
MGNRISLLLTGDPNDISLNLRGLYGYQNVVIHTAQVLGSGSYGNVVKATLDKKPCAAKILHRVFIDSQDPGLSDFVSRFEQECQILRDLKHPNIVQFLGVVQDPTTNKPILLMELMKDSLTHFLESSPTNIPYHVQVNISHDIALAVAHLHRNGILHRDLSSNNILLNASYQAKVTDFGMSKIADSNLSMTRSKVTKCPGTLVYMPPEALRPEPRYSDKIDTFSIGVLLLQIVTRKFPAPTAEFVTKTDPNSPTKKSYVPIPEVDRRKSDIDKVPSLQWFSASH